MTFKKSVRIAARRLAAFYKEAPPRTWEDIEAAIETIDEFGVLPREVTAKVVVTPAELRRSSLRLCPPAKRSLH